MDLREATEHGDLTAIEQYIKELIKENNYVDAQKWALQGAELGSVFCMYIYCHSTIMLVHIQMQITPGEKTARKGIQELLKAEEWGKVIDQSGQEDSNNILTSSTGVYSQLTWCYYVTALETKEAEAYKNVIEYYEKIRQKPQSRESYAYMMALDAVGEEKKAFDIANKIHEEHDTTLESFMLEVVCAHLMQAFLDGKVTQPNYEKAALYAQECYEINPEQNSGLLEMFENGNVKKEFEQKHNTSIAEKESLSAAVRHIETKDNRQSSLQRTKDNTCPSCGAQIKNWDNYCGRCGSKLFPTETRPQNVKKNNKKVLVAIVAVVMLTIGMFATHAIVNIIQKSKSQYIARFQDERGKWGYMDEYGNVIVECKYDEAQDFTESGFAVVGVRQSVNYDGEGLQYGVIDIQGNEVIQCKNISINIKAIGDPGYYFIEQYDEDNDTLCYGVANIDGTVMINPEYYIVDSIGDSKQYIACFQNAEDSSYGVLNESCEWVIEPQYSWLDVFIDEKGEPITIDGQYCLLAYKDDTVGLIDASGSTLLPFEYGSIQNSCNTDYIQVCDTSGYYGVINASLEPVFDCVFDDISNFSVNGKAIANKDSVTYLISTDEIREIGQGMTGSCYQDILFEIYSENEEKYGVIDEDGNWILRPEYDYVSVNGQYITAELEDSGETYLYDRTGVLISSGYYSYEIYEDINEVIPVYNGDYYGAIDQTGNEIVECYYDYEMVQDGWINLYDVENPRGTLVSPNGEVITNEYTRYFVSSDKEFITAWLGNDWNDNTSGLLVQSVILNSDGSMKKQINNKYTVGPLMKVR